MEQDQCNAKTIVYIYEYSLRNSNDTQTVHARTTLYYKSFYPQLSENGII